MQVKNSFDSLKLACCLWMSKRWACKKGKSGCFTACATLWSVVDHMCLLMVVGMFGPCRAFPLPPASIEPLFITRHAGETKHSLRISRLSCHLARAKWILGKDTTNERNWGKMTGWDVLTWHKRISKVIAWAKERRKRRDKFDASNNRQMTFPVIAVGLGDNKRGLQLNLRALKC